MGQAETQPHYYTIEEYFALEEMSEVRHEFYEGWRTEHPGNA